jgi:hypothetical protein
MAETAFGLQRENIAFAAFGGWDAAGVRSYHQEGARNGERAPEAIEHGEAVGVDVAPVMDLSFREP